MGLLSIISAGCAQLVKMLITLEPHGIFESILHIYLFNIVQPLVCKMVTRLFEQHLAGRDLLVKILTILERAIYFDQTLLTHTFFEISRENDKEKKNILKKLITPGF